MSTQEAIQPTPSKFFYGWNILIVSALTTFIVQGTYYCFGIFYGPLGVEFGVNRASIALIASFMTLMQPVGAIVGGYVVDRWGPRVSGAITVCFFTIGLLLASFAGSLVQVYASLGFIFGFGLGIHLTPLLATISRWFVKHRGLATGLVVSGSGVGSIVLPLMVTTLIGNYGWRPTMQIMAGIGLVITLVMTLVIRKDAAAKGLKPLGFVEQAKSATGTSSQSAAASGMTLKQAVSTGKFWLVFGFMFFMITVAAMTTIHLYNYAQDEGMTAMQAAGLLSTYGIFAILGKLGGGALCDKLGPKKLLVTAAIMMVLGMFFFYLVPSLGFLYVAMGFYAFGNGIVGATAVLLAAHIFGTTHVGKIYSIFLISAAVGGFAAIYLAGWVYDTTGTYSSAYLVATILSAISLVCISLVRVPKLAHKVEGSGSAPRI